MFLCQLCCVLFKPDLFASNVLSDAKSSENREASIKGSENDDSGYVTIKENDVVLRSLEDDSEAINGDMSDGKTGTGVARDVFPAQTSYDVNLKMAPVQTVAVVTLAGEISGELGMNHVSIQTLKTSKKVRKIVAGGTWHANEMVGMPQFPICFLTSAWCYFFIVTVLEYFPFVCSLFYINCYDILECYSYTAVLFFFTAAKMQFAWFVSLLTSFNLLFA